MGTLACTVELDKVAGLTVTVENAAASTTQTVKMNGVTIELKVTGPAGTSTYTQSAEKVAVVCREFEVTAERTISSTVRRRVLGGTAISRSALDAPQEVSASSVDL